MKKAIVGKKIGMTQVFAEDGRLVPVTVIEAGPCTVVQTKNKESDGYEAVQVGFGDLTENRAKKLLNKPELGHFKKSAISSPRATRSTSPEPARVTATPAPFSAGTSTPAPWLTAPSITAASVP